ncbi:hypothetical protein GGI20_000279 [Coemansia sp. BCRC 34301]|nr:hypothetical protein GGI20_000279 [Coemansia sp. BCRC 34301]
MEAGAEWSALLEKFFQQAELFQCLRALQLETVVFASASQSGIYDDLRSLADDIHALLLARQRQQQVSPAGQAVASEGSNMELDSQLPEAPGIIERHNARTQDVMQNMLTKEQTLQAIDGFVARQREEIDSNNRDEFLVSAEGRDTTCARIDAKGTNRGVQIQVSDSSALQKSTLVQPDTADHSGDSRSLPLDGLTERVDNLSEHLSVGFTPASASLHNRVAALEDRLMMLEREFPPWSAQHFHQPGRTYTQPPPATVYRILPASATDATPGAAPALAAETTAAPDRLGLLPGAPTSMPVRPRGGKRGRPRLSGSLVSRPQSTPRRQRRPVIAEAPRDPTGRPLFHICGRGVNSSLTRTILAQLQSKQPPALPKPDSGAPSSPHHDS